MKKTKRIFRHFLAILNVIACGVPLLTLGIVTLQDALPKYFTSLGMQHHGDGSSTFEDDLAALDSNNQFNDVNENILQTLDKMDYLKYGGESTKIVKKTLQTNEVNSADDLIEENVYMIKNISNDGSEDTLSDVFINNNYINHILYFHFDGLSSSFFEEFYTDEQTITNLFDYDFYMSYSIQYHTLFSTIYDNNDYINLSVGYVDNNNSFTFMIFQYFSDGSFDFEDDIDDLFTHGFIQSCPELYLQYTSYYDEVESEIVGYNGWKAAFDGESYSTIVSEGTDTHLVLNVDFLSLFQSSEIVNYNNNVAIYLFINFYFNYLLNILLLLFLPEFILLFIDFIKQLLYKFTDVKGDS